jgi:hypothetical protein
MAYKTQALLTERRIWELMTKRESYIYDYSVEKTLPNYEKLSKLYPDIEFLRGRSKLCDIYLSNMCANCPLNCMNIWSNSNYSYYQNWINAKSLKSKLSSAEKILELIDAEINKDLGDMNKLNDNDDIIRGNNST